MAIQFPNSPGIGSVFTDTDAGFSYEWTGVVWKSFTPAAANNIKELDDISSGFNNSTTTFNLTIGGAAYQPRNAAMLQISLGGVIQEPGTDYTVSTSTITFTTAPNAGLDFFGVVRGTAVAIDYANNGNVQTKQEFTATEGQTSFTVTGGYRTGYVDVFRNGVRLGSDDFTDTSGTAIVLTVPAQASDLVEVVKYNVASLVVSEGQFTNLNVTGIITGGSFSGDGSGLTGVASTDNIQTATPAKFLSDVSITGVTTVGVVTGGTSISAGVFYGDGSALTGIDATKLTDSGGSTIVQANPNGAVVTGVLTATTGSFSGNVTIGGTLTYQDVTNMDVLGIGTFQQGIQVLANGLNISGVSTFNDNVRLLDDDELLIGTNGTSGDFKVYRDSGNTRNILYEDVSGAEARFISNLGGADSAAFTFLKNTDTIARFSDVSVRLYSGGVEKFETHTAGINITGGVDITGVCTANSFSGDGSALTGVSVAIGTDSATPENTIQHLDLSNAQDHKLTVSGITTISATGGTEGESHTVRIINSGISTVGFSTFFLFASGASPSMPTADGAISLISFTVNRVGAAGTQLLAGASVNYS